MQERRSIAAAAAEIRAGRLHPRELAERCLTEIARRDARLRAWVLVDDKGALAAADRAAEELAAGYDRGPLHGIPLGIKDIVDVAGWPTLAGSRVRPSTPAVRDATLVARLRDAGAVFLGKTVTTEFASFDPPPTRNPWDERRTPGGSSSGSAAAVAAGMCWGAIGSQTGGSITRPASYCGVAGCKPTFGRVSTAGLVPLSFHLDHPGPIARCVADLAILLQAIAGGDPRDPMSADDPVPDYRAYLAPAELTRPRCGVPTDYFREGSEPALWRTFEQAVEQLRSAGARIVPIELPTTMRQVEAMHRRIMAVEAAESHRATFAERRGEYGPAIAGLIDEGLATSATDYAEALKHQADFRRDLAHTCAACDCLLTPATPSTAPASLETTGNPRFNSPWSHAGWPTVSLPCGLAEDGMPVAAQLVARPLAEGPLLAAAAWCEQAWRFTAAPPA